MAGSRERVVLGSAVQRITRAALVPARRIKKFPLARNWLTVASGIGFWSVWGPRGVGGDCEVKPTGFFQAQKIWVCMTAKGHFGQQCLAHFFAKNGTACVSVPVLECAQCLAQGTHVLNFGAVGMHQRQHAEQTVR